MKNNKPAPLQPAKSNFNTKKDEHFSKINELLSGGKFNHSMDKSIDNAHKRLAKEGK